MSTRWRDQYVSVYSSDAGIRIRSRVWVKPRSRKRGLTSTWLSLLVLTVIMIAAAQYLAQPSPGFFLIIAAAGVAPWHGCAELAMQL